MLAFFSSITLVIENVNVFKNLTLLFLKVINSLYFKEGTMSLACSAMFICYFEIKHTQLFVFCACLHPKCHWHHCILTYLIKTHSWLSLSMFSFKYILFSSKNNSIPKTALTFNDHVFCSYFTFNWINIIRVYIWLSIPESILELLFIRHLCDSSVNNNIRKLI